jgi:H3 lysine-79-specific histone-lysine N-methyltransferase
VAKRFNLDRFELVLPLESDGYDSTADIEETIDQICRNYFPATQSSSLCDELTGFKRRLKRSRDKNDLQAYSTAIVEFNALITSSLADSTIQTTLDNLHNLPLPLVERIINQTYCRTISPQVQLLKQYENGTDNVYGELLPRFAHDVFFETELRSDHVFVDLGSGVGNVVLQAALETGCEAWGIEQMANPARLGAAQLVEFEERCKRWSLRPGKVTLLQGDFLISEEIDKVLKRADVVLVNNQAFTPALNEKLMLKFLDLKEGARIVSLKSFVPEKWEIKARSLDDVRNVLSVRRKAYGTRSVSWTDEAGDWFVAIKDSRNLETFQRRMMRRGGN